MNKFKLVLPIILIVAFLLPLTGQAQESETDTGNSLLAMLAFVPDTPELRASRAYIAYTDFRAGEQALGMDISNSTSFEAFKPDGALGDIWRLNLMRFSLYSGMNYIRWYIEEMPALVGLEWFDFNRILEYGEIPTVVQIYDVNPERIENGQMGESLSAREFEVQDVDGIPVWHRFEDNKLEPSMRETGDPFGGDIGKAARIGVFPGYLVHAPNWSLIEETLALYQGEEESLAEADDFRVLATAMKSKGGIIQAMIFPNMAALNLAFLPDNPMSMLPGAEEENTFDFSTWGTLPVFQIAALADYQDGDEHVHMMLLVYANAEDAQAAADELTRRISTYDPMDTYEVLGVEIDEASIYTDEESGLSVAIASLRYPLSLEPIEPLNRPRQPGLLFSHWIRQFMVREFFYFRVEPVQE